MKKTLAIILLCILSSTSFAQELPKELENIITEGKLLYRSERASWIGTDLFLERYTNKDNIGGYFSYFDDDKTKCVFFSKADNPKVIGTMTFDSTFNMNTVDVNMQERDFVKKELESYEIRQLAFQVIYSDTIFKTYNNTSLNVIPLITETSKKVYVLTGPQANDVVIFGNDYLISFNEENKPTRAKMLHKNIIPIYNKESKSAPGEALSTMHSHSEETGEYITPTDICTLMLYEKYANWKTHIVVSQKYLNIWDCNTNELTLLSNKEAKKLAEAVEKKSRRNRK